MVTYDQTKQKYHGRKAETYEEIRHKQERWDLENAAVEGYLKHKLSSPVLDVPVGTGRFLPLYEKLGLRCYGIDASEEMLRIARRKRGAKNATLKVGDATQMGAPRAFGTVVCVRFLDLIPEDAMLAVLAEACSVARSSIILTIRLGEKYVNKSNTCTHDRRKFYRAVKKHGWEVAHATPIFKQGWEVVHLLPQEK